jgi:hypothetical protein
MAGLLTDFLGPAAKSAGLLIDDYIRSLRLNRWTKLLADVKSNCEKAHVDPANLPPAILLPAMEAAKDVDDPDLQEMWARLLSNAAADANAQQPMFVDALKRLSGGDARVFDEFVRAKPSSPDRAVFDKNPLHTALERLESLGLIERTISARTERTPQIGRVREIIRIQDTTGRQHEIIKNPPQHGQIRAKIDPVRISRSMWVVSRFGWQFHAAVARDPVSPPGESPAE